MRGIRSGIMIGAAGLAAGSLLTLWATPDRDVRRHAARVVVPKPCLEAIDAAEERLLLNSEVPNLASSYASVWDRVVDAARDLDVGAFTTITADVRRLNRRARGLAQSAANAEFSRPARECEELAANARR